MYQDFKDADAVLGVTLAVLGFSLVVGLVLGAVLYVLICLPLSRIFEKAGIEKWKAWVPYYSTYLWLQLGGVNGYWVLASLIPLGSYVLAVFQYIAMYRQGFAFGKDGAFVVLGIFLPIVWLFVLAYGQAPYEPGRIAAANQPGPFIGYGAVPPPAPAGATGYPTA